MIKYKNFLNELRIGETVKKLTLEEKIEILNKIVRRRGISGMKWETEYHDYLKAKENGFNYPDLENELSNKRKELKMINIIKKNISESVKNDDSAVVLNLKEKGGKLIDFHPVYAVTTTKYEQGYPPLIQQISKERRTEKQKLFLKLANYLDEEFNRILKVEKVNRIFSNIDPYGEEDWDGGIVEFLENIGIKFRKKTWGTGVTEITTHFNNKEEIDKFLENVKKYQK